MTTKTELESTASVTNGACDAIIWRWRMSGHSLVSTPTLLISGLRACGRRSDKRSVIRYVNCWAFHQVGAGNVRVSRIGALHIVWFLPSKTVITSPGPTQLNSTQLNSTQLASWVTSHSARFAVAVELVSWFGYRAMWSRPQE